MYVKCALRHEYFSDNTTQQWLVHQQLLYCVFGMSNVFNIREVHGCIENELIHYWYHYTKINQVVQCSQFPRSSDLVVDETLTAWRYLNNMDKSE